MTDSPQIAPTEAKSEPVPIPVETKVEPIINEAPAETPESKPDVETLIPTDSYHTDPLFYAISDYFNIPPEEYSKSKDYLSEITDYLIRETESNDPSVLIVKMREIEDKVKAPEWGEKRYWNIRKYIRLASRKNEFERAMGAISK